MSTQIWLLMGLTTAPVSSFTLYITPHVCVTVEL